MHDKHYSNLYNTQFMLDRTQKDSHSLQAEMNLAGAHSKVRDTRLMHRSYHICLVINMPHARQKQHVI